MSRFVAVRIEGELTVHIPDSTGNYATLCGLDGDDPHAAVQMEPAEVPRGAKVNCNTCKSIWKVATQYRATDFD